MNAEDLLATCAEVSVALAGFIGIAAAFRRQERGFALHDIASVRFVLEVSFTALFFALMPGVLWNLGVAEGTSWRLAAVLLGAWLVMLFVFQTRRRNRLEAIDGGTRTALPGRRYYLAAYLIISLGVAVAGVVDLRVRGAFVLGIAMLLVAAAMEFLAFAASLQPGRDPQARDPS